MKARRATGPVKTTISVFICLINRAVVIIRLRLIFKILD
jgi:hypothetical protein